MDQMSRPPRRASTALAMAGALLLSACGADGMGPNASSPVGVGFQVARTSPTMAMLAVDGAPVLGSPPRVTSNAEGLVVERGDDEIVITEAQLVIKDVQLKRASAVCRDDDDDDDDDDNDKNGNDRDDDDCPSIRVGPFLVNMPVSGADAGRVAVPVPEGSYSSVQLRIHKVTSNTPSDLAFRQANPDFRDISVRLEGTYNGAPFTFINDVNAKIDVPLASPLAIGTDADNVTVMLDLSTWFVNPNGGLYSPELANTPGLARARVQNSIRRAFRAFRDRDRDGRED